MIIRTKNPNVVLLEQQTAQGREFTALRRTVQDKREYLTFIFTKDGKHITDRFAAFALNKAEERINEIDLYTRRRLARKGWSIKKIPDMESNGPLSMMPDECFDTEDIYG